MVRRIACSVALIAVGLFGSSAPVMAFYDSLTVIPASPRAGQGFSFSIRTGGRDSVIAINALDRDVFRQGNTIRVTLRAFVQLEGGPLAPPSVYVFNLDALEPGNYRLEVARRNLSSINDVALVATTDFVVVGSVGEPIPATDWRGLMFLVLALSAVGLFAMRVAHRRE